MVTKIIKCPSCGNRVSATGEFGQQVEVVCPKCNKKGIFKFKDEKSSLEIGSNLNSIEVANLTKKYGKFTALNNISFSVKKGEVFGFLGPNGAGKTTTIQILTSVLRPTKGTAVVNGFDISKKPLDAKKRIGYMPDVPGFYGEMKAYNVLNFYAEFYRIPKKDRKKKIDELFNLMQLTEFKNKKVKTYSRGMKQKLGFASSLINDPEILILDEPTIGLDPSAVRFFRNTLSSLNKKGVTIFLSSHILSEVQAICDKVCIINRGEIVAVDSIESLGSKVAAKNNITVIFSFEKITDQAISAIKTIDGVISIEKNKKSNKLEIQIKADKSIISNINKLLVKHNINILGIETMSVNLEDIFLSLTEDA